MFKTITPIFSVVIALAVFFFFTKPMFAEIKLVEAETTEYEEAVLNATAFNQRLSELLQIRNGFGALKMERLDALVPEQVDEVKLLVDLEQIALSHNMLLGNIEVSESEAGDVAEEGTAAQLNVQIDDFTTAAISFGLIGTYEQFRSFLHDLERSLVLMEITNISFNANEGDLQEYEVTIEAFALPSSI